jgi:hypothetical protein
MGRPRHANINEGYILGQQLGEGTTAIVRECVSKVRQGVRGGLGGCWVGVGWGGGHGNGEDDDPGNDDGRIIAANWRWPWCARSRRVKGAMGGSREWW